MARRNRSHSGKGILIAVVLGPLCAAAADLPGRALSTPAEPVANLEIQTFEHAKVSRGDIATVLKARSIRKQQNSFRSLAAQIELPPSPVTFPSLITRLAADADHSVRSYWLENPTSAGP